MPEPPHHNGQGCLVRWSGGQAVVALPGQVGWSNAGPVGEQLLAVVDRGAAVLIADMTATRSCDHAGTGVLAWVYQRAVAQGTELRLVIGTPVVRRVVTLSGLDQLVPVFPTLSAAKAAQRPAAVVVPLPPRAAGNGSAAPPDGPRPVAWLPVAGPASLDGFGRAAKQGMRRGQFEDALTRITGGIFEAGVTLQAALGQSGDGLRQAARHTLDLLDDTVREARDAAFASHRQAAHGLADAAEPAAAARLTVPVSPVSPRVPAGDVVRRSQLQVMQARRTRARAELIRAQVLQLAVLSAANQDRVAVALSQAASTHPSIAAHLRAFSQTADRHTAWARQRAHDHAVTG